MGLLQIIGMILFLVVDFKFSIVKTKKYDDVDDDDLSNSQTVNSGSIIQPILNNNNNNTNLLSATISNYGTNNAVETLN